MDILEVLGNTDDGVYAVGPDQRIIFWTETAEGMLGYSAQDVLGRHCYELLAGRDTDGNPVCSQGCHAINAAKLSGRAPSHYCLLRTKQGTSLWVHMTHLVIPSANGNLDSVVHMFRDVSEYAEAKQLVENLLPFIAQLPGRDGAQAQETPDPEQVAALSRRELQVLSLLARGASPNTIADTLVISPATSRNHIQHILAKLGVHSVLGAVAFAYKHRLL